MKIALITLSTPTPDNVRTASALGYHIAKFRNSNIELDIFSYNLNKINVGQLDEIGKELNSQITIIPITNCVKYLFKSWSAPIRAFVPKPMLAYLKLSSNLVEKLNSDYDGFWIYGEDISYFANYFRKKPIVITTPDCEALYYHRVLGKAGIAASWKSVLRYSIMLYKYARMESSFPIGENICYHLVGEADRDFLTRTVPGINAIFIPHPHYNYSQKEISFNQNKIRLLIAGRYNFYMEDACDEMADILVAHRYLSEDYKITFLGKGWDFLVEKLNSVGYTVDYKTYVEDYRGELIKHDIQLTPISVGTGTKGKVLDAIANGLLAIGTPGALENISVLSGISCYEYKKGEELIEILNKIKLDRRLAEQIAIKGREKVLSMHSREIIAKEFFDLFNL